MQMPQQPTTAETGAMFGGACETHTAVIFLVGDRAYKLKKPVNLGFLNFSTRDRREAACHDEVTLNRRLCPDVYLGVADVLGPDRLPCDHLVVMRRMPDERRLATLVRAGAPVDDDIRRLARLLAAFHASARRGPDISMEGGRNAILGRWSASFEQVRPYRGTVLDDDLTAEVERRTRDFLAGRQRLFGERIAAGRIVDGHGDLLADDIYCLDAGPRVLDCIEFNDKLRWLDGLDDAAFLAMDLEYLNAPHLAARFLDWYAEFSGDPAPPSLRHHYVAYRAFVRTKVACLRASQGDPTAADEAARHARLAADHLRAGAVRLILVGGLPGTGKSTLASALADRMGAVQLNTDRIRKELAGMPAEASARAAYSKGIYSTLWTAHTYTEMLDRARALLSRGETVILDASWSKAVHRTMAARLAEQSYSELLALRCEVPAAVASARLVARTGDASDADPETFVAMARRADAWPEAIAVRTDAPPDECVEKVLVNVAAMQVPYRVRPTATPAA